MFDKILLKQVFESCYPKQFLEVENYEKLSFGCVGVSRFGKFWNGLQF